MGSPGPGLGTSVGCSVGSSVGLGVRRTGAAVGVSGSSVGSGVSNSVLRVGDGVVGPKTIVGGIGMLGIGVGGIYEGSGVGSVVGSGVGAEGSAVGWAVGVRVLGAGEANSDRRVGWGTEPSELEGCGVRKAVFLVGTAVGLR